MLRVGRRRPPQPGRGAGARRHPGSAARPLVGDRLALLGRPHGHRADRANDPFWWLTAERDATITKRSMWMLRVVDAPGAIAARGFAPAVSVTVPLEVHDQARPANSGRWQLTIADGKGALIPDGPVSADGSPAAPLRLGARGLAALYAGAQAGACRLSGLASGGSPDDDAALDAAFAATSYMLDDF